MGLSNLQQEFTLKIAKLIQFAYKQGYGLTFGDAYRDPRTNGEWGEKVGYSAAYSVHKKRLAVDLNVFKSGEYLQGDEAGEAHNILHNFWDSVGGAPRISDDLNHYSLEYQGHY